LETEDDVILKGNVIFTFHCSTMLGDVNQLYGLSFSTTTTKYVFFIVQRSMVKLDKKISAVTFQTSSAALTY
jgi:hypothetical protein